jgi:plastocyanin domain-containing protein
VTNRRTRVLCLLPLCLAAACAGAGGGPPQARSVRMLVSERGFEPDRVELERGRPVALVITRTTDDTCAREIVIDEYGIHAPLPLGTPVTVEFTPTESGQLRYGCAMGKMIGGVFSVE